MAAYMSSHWDAGTSANGFILVFIRQEQVLVGTHGYTARCSEIEATLAVAWILLSENLAHEAEIQSGVIDDVAYGPGLACVSSAMTTTYHAREELRSVRAYRPILVGAEHALHSLGNSHDGDRLDRDGISETLTLAVCINPRHQHIHGSAPSSDCRAQ